MSELTNSTEVRDAAYKLGREQLGRVFACFGHLLLRHAHHLGCARLAFVARDGDLLMRVTEKLMERTGTTNGPALTYVHISRQTSFLPALDAIDKGTLDEALGLRGERGTLTEALRYLGMPLAPIAPALARLAIDPDRTDVSPAAMSLLVSDEEVRIAVQRESSRQKALLATYLEQESIGAAADTLLVDVGWRGSILSNLAKAYSGASGFRSPAGAFFGLWSESKPLSGLPSGTVGLIADIRRRHTVLEASAWLAAFMLEAVCRADEGTTIGYEFRGEKVTPILAGDSKSRRAEERVLPVVADVRRGIMDYIDEHGSADEWLCASSDQVRKRAQRALLRLACFPNAAEIAIGAMLVHTEGHTPNWSLPLITSTDANPLFHPRRWLAGLASPWRAGYIRHTGGPVLAASFLLLESAFLAVSPDFRAAVTRIARRAADRNRRPN